MITTEKGVALDFDSVSRDSKNLSRQMYTWGQQGEADIKDGVFHAFVATKEGYTHAAEYFSF